MRLLILVALAVLSPRQDQNSPRKDLYGDALPEGAIVRMGTLRLRSNDVICAIAFSPDGNTIASSEARTIRLWNSATGEQIRAFPINGDRPAFSLAFSPDGKCLAAAGHEKTVRLWDVATGKELASVGKHGETVNYFAFSPDGKTLASTGREIRLWDLATNKAVRTIQVEEGYPHSIKFSRNGELLAFYVSTDETIRLWSCKAGRETKAWRMPGGVSIAFSPDGATLASGGDDKAVHLWDTTSGTQIRALEGHTGGVYSVAFSPDGKTLASAGKNNEVRLWDSATGKNLRALDLHSEPVGSLAFSPDGNVIAFASRQTIVMWDASLEKKHLDFEGHADSVASVAFSPDGKNLATSGSPIRLWNAATGKHLSALERSASSVCFAPDGKTFAAASYDRTIRLWDTATGKEIRSITGHDDLISCVVFSPDGKTLASASWDNTVAFWDVATGKELRRLPLSDCVYCVTFSPDGKTLASSNRKIPVPSNLDKPLHLWDVATGKEIRALETEHSGDIIFSPDGKYLASIGGVGPQSDRAIILWDTGTGKKIREWQGDAEGVMSIAISPDGRTLASGGRDNTVRLWDEAGGEIGVLQGHAGPVGSVAFSPDGKSIASGSYDATALVWTLAPKGYSAKRDLEALWRDLASSDAGTSYRAMWSLSAQDKCMTFLYDRLFSAAAVPDEKRFRALLADLDDDSIEVREAAAEGLFHVGFVGLLRETAERLPDGELRKRIRRSLEPWETETAPEARRRSKAIQALERLGSPEARDLLREMAEKSPIERERRDAGACLARLRQ